MRPRSTRHPKRRAPRTLRAPGRAVALQEFEILAEDFPAIARARSLLGVCLEGGGGCKVTVHVVPES